MGIKDYIFDPVWTLVAVSFANFLISVVNFFTDLLFGYSFSYGSKAERRRAEDDFEHSAQLVDVWFFGVFSIIDQRTLKNFFWKHDRYVSPRYVTYIYSKYRC